MILPGLGLPPIVLNAGVAAQPPAFQFLTSSASGSNLVTHTFSSLTLGVPDADRWIIVGVSSQDTSIADHTIASVTIGGVSASKIAGWGSSDHYAEIWAANVPSEGTGDVVVSNESSVACNRRAVFLYRAVMSSGTAHDSTNLTGNPSPTGTLDVPADGFAVGVANAFDDNAFSSWTGLDEDADIVVSSGRRASSASVETDVLLTGLTVTANHPTSSASRGAAASWVLP